MIAMLSNLLTVTLFGNYLLVKKFRKLKTTGVFRHSDGNVPIERMKRSAWLLSW